MIDRQAIINAFAKVPHPGDDRLCACDCDECQWEIANFKNKKWSRLQPSDFDAENGGANVSFLTPEALHYFMPGFLLLAIDHPEFDWLLSRTFSRLVISDSASEKSREHVRKLFTRLSLAQRAVLLSVLEHERDPVEPPSVAGEALVCSLHNGKLTPYSQAAAQLEVDEIMRQLRTTGRLT